MIRIDAFYFFQIGAALRPLSGITHETTKRETRYKLWTAHHWLEGLLQKSVYTLRTCVVSGNELLGTLARINDDYGKDDVDLDSNIEFIDQHYLTTQVQTFEANLSAELQWGNLYLVQPKGGYDLNQLTENGIVLFPSSLASKIPEAIKDAKEAARCIAFELPTAAAFHLHRLNEVVLRHYYEYVTGGKPHPERRIVTKYIDAMKGYQVGDRVVFGALSTLVHLHRNPVLHPEQSLDTVEQAIALLGSVNSVVSYMLSALPPEPLKLVPPPADENITKQIEAKETIKTDDTV